MWNSPQSLAGSGSFPRAATVARLAAYAVTRTIGLLSLESSDQPIRDRMFAILEILIIVMMPAIVSLMIAVHAFGTQPSEGRSASPPWFCACSLG